MMEKILTILATALIAGTAAAEPPKGAPAKAAEAKPPAAEVVLASAETAHAAASQTAESNGAPVKRRVARVTTCRCGDPQVEPDSQEQ
jgi:hypothetical protein